jgi:hypothetical protein
MEINKDNTSNILTNKKKLQKKRIGYNNHITKNVDNNIDIQSPAEILTNNPDVDDKNKKKLLNTKKIYKCEECNFTASTPSNFLKHLTSEKHKRHGEKKVNKCDICDYVSNSIYNYNVHKITQHGSSEEKKEKCPFYCDICDVGFFSKIFFDKHINSKNHANLKLIKEIQEKDKKMTS